MDRITTALLTNIDPVYGFIILLISIIFISILKILGTVRITRTNEKSIEDLIDNDSSNQDLFIPASYLIQPGDSPAEDFGIELSSIPVNTSISFKEHIIARSPDISTDNPSESISFSDPFSFIQAELKHDPEIQNFTLFTNPQHIFSGALKEIFAKKVALVLNHMEDYRFKVYPYYKIEDSKIYRFFLDERQNIVIEELFELWRMGYSHPALPELFIHYFFAIHSDQATLILKSMINHQQLEKKELRRICFLYQDILNQKISFSDIQEEFPEKINNAFDLANVLIFKNFYLTRKKWHNWEESIFRDLQEDRKGLFYLFYFDLLVNRTSLILYYLIINNFKHILNSQWRIFIERQAFYYGHYEKLNRLSFIPPEFSALISKSAAESAYVVQDLLSLLKNKSFFELHKFLVYYINNSKEMESYNIEPVKLDEFLRNLDIKHREKNYVPQAIRFLLYLYYYEKKDLQKVNYITPYIHGRIGKFIPRLYQVRLLFKAEQYERAWLDINDLWNNDEDNMLLMNETAVYAYHSGRIKEAEELFSRLRSLYPENVQVLHNEAVFLQHKARLISEKKKFYGAHIFRENFPRQKSELETSPEELHPAI